MDVDTRLTKRQKRALRKEEKAKLRKKREVTKRLRKWSVGLLVFVGLFVGGMLLWRWINTPTVPVGDLVNITDNDNVRGNPDAELTIVEYSDFECPACANYDNLLGRLVDERDDVRFVYRHFPLTQIHNNALDAARAAEAAGMQGKFWEMHDLLFARQDQWSNKSNIDEMFYSFAEELGLDEDRFSKDLESSEVVDKVFSDITTANQLRINSTPTFYINGEKVNLPGNYEGIVELIEDW